MTSSETRTSQISSSTKPSALPPATSSGAGRSPAGKRGPAETQRKRPKVTTESHPSARDQVPARASVTDHAIADKE